MKNLDVRSYAIENSVKLWEIAERLNINDGNFSRRLRKELPADQKERIKEIIDEIVKEREEAWMESEKLPSIPDILDFGNDPIFDVFNGASVLDEMLNMDWNIPELDLNLDDSLFDDIFKDWKRIWRR